MKQLIEDYKRRLQNVKELLIEQSLNDNGSENNIKRHERLATKASEYRTFIAELERLERNIQVVKPDETVCTNGLKIPTGILDANKNMLFENDILPDQTPQLIVLCRDCNSDNVLIKNLEKMTGLCINCTGEHKLYATKLKADAKVIGYQVLSNTNDCALHPKMEASFCLYSLKQCKRIVRGETSNWRIQTIWSGDIEEPTLMFHNKPK